MSEIIELIEKLVHELSQIEWDCLQSIIQWISKAEEMQILPEVF